MRISQPTVNLITSEEYISPNEFKPARHLAGGDVYEQARRIPHDSDFLWSIYYSYPALHQSVDEVPMVYFCKVGHDWTQLNMAV